MVVDGERLDATRLGQSLLDLGGELVILVRELALGFRELTLQARQLAAERELELAVGRVGQRCPAKHGRNRRRSPLLEHGIGGLGGCFRGAHARCG